MSEHRDGKNCPTSATANALELNSGPDYLQLHSADALAVALRDLPAGTMTGHVQLLEPIARGHKFALQDIAHGNLVRKYGQVIGYASTMIAAGSHVHVHNLAFDGSIRSQEQSQAYPPPAAIPELVARTFLGYRRASGRAGTRNFVGILTTVNCSATVAKQIAKRFGEALLPEYPNVDGVVALTHTSGCGMSHQGDGIEVLQRTIAGYASQPNFAGVLLIGLGCEVNQLDRLMQTQNLTTSATLRTLSIQAVGGTQAAIAKGIEQVQELLELANACQRQPIPLAELTLALQCGGSDGWSGITANPALGAAADLLISAGGAVVLSETPEIYGAESLLYARAENPSLIEKLAGRLRWWEDYAAKHQTDLNNNPSPGNIAGGLTTILEKSLGAVAKSGRGTMVEILQYAEPVQRRGFQFMDTPGYDPCSATGQIAGGCNLMAFTTGRGAVFGAKPVPSIKLASNSRLARHQSDDIDIDCGGIVERAESIEEVGWRVFEKLLAVASGEKSASEQLGFGEAEFVPWQIGAVM